MQPYTRHPHTVVDHGKFKHVMAIALDPRGNYKTGAIRCITSREGDIAAKGTIDRSEIHLIMGNSLYDFAIGEKIIIQNEEEIIESINADQLDFLGLEDPDIWINEKTGLLHMYFTLPLIDSQNENHQIFLGHAVGEDLHSLRMTMPVLAPDAIGGAKELSIAPVNKKGVRLNLVESSETVSGITYSTIRVAVAPDMNGPWAFGETALHPGNCGDFPWIAGHASPGPLFSKEFLDVGDGKLLGIINGCEANKITEDKIIYGTFSIGLCIYDYEAGTIDWVSPSPLINDSRNENRKITFASQLIETEHGQAVLYAHIDDSFIRAYTLQAETLQSWMEGFQKKQSVNNKNRI